MTILTAHSINLASAATPVQKFQSHTGARIKSLILLLGNALSVYQERRELLKLTDQELNDIGITRQQMLSESKRSFFDVPAR